MPPGRAPGRCRICGASTKHFGVGRVLGRLDAAYSRCNDCYAVLAENPTWLDEAYSEAIAAQDIGLISRNLLLSKQVDSVLKTCFPNVDQFLDFGAGNGMFVRMMRDRGFDFRYSDPHAMNQFANGFEQDARDEPAQVVTAMEVLEHLLHPVEELRPIAEPASALLVSTLLVPDEPPPLDQWWYYSLQSGQHITIFNRRSLDALAAQLGFKRTSVGSLHLLARRRLSRRRLAVALRLVPILNLVSRRESLLASDFETLFDRKVDTP